MINFKRQKFFAIIYISFLSSLIYANQELNNDEMPNQEHYKKCSNSCDHLKSCDHLRSCDHKRSRDCCHHKKDVKSYEKKLGIIRGTVRFNGPPNVSFTVSQTPIPGSSPDAYLLESTINNPDFKLIKKGNCFKANNLQITGFYGPKSPYTIGGIIVYVLTIDIEFKKKFKDIPTVLVSSSDLVTEQVLVQAGTLTSKSFLFSYVNKAINITNKGFQIFKLVYGFVAPLPDNSNTITLSQDAQEAINLDLNIFNMAFIASGELCD